MLLHGGPRGNHLGHVQGDRDRGGHHVVPLQVSRGATKGAYYEMYYRAETRKIQLFLRHRPLGDPLAVAIGIRAATDQSAGCCSGFGFQLDREHILRISISAYLTHGIV